MLALALALLAVTPDGVPSPRDRGRWVVDAAEILPAEAEERMNRLIERLERDTTAEIAVVTVADTDRVPKDFATALFARWKIGKATADNGLLVLLVVGQRRLEMETGYGLEPVLPDGWLGLMQKQAMVPAFKQGDYAKGLEAGLARIDAELRSSPEAVREGTRRKGATVVRAARSIGWSGLVAGLVFLSPIGLAFAYAAAKRRERRCDRCQKDMRLLTDQADDAYLSEGQRAEERLGSVDYLVYLCDPCERQKIVPKNKWFSGSSRCSRCRFRTLQSSSITLRSATYSHGGEVQVTESCAHCHYKNRYTRLTPQLTRSTTSSSGGSFGGGRSGGGGAGSSW